MKISLDGRCTEFIKDFKYSLLSLLETFNHQSESKTNIDTYVPGIDMNRDFNAQPSDATLRLRLLFKFTLSKTARRNSSREINDEIIESVSQTAAADSKLQNGLETYR